MQAGRDVCERVRRYLREAGAGVIDGSQRSAAGGEPPQPRWAPDVALAARVTRRGRFATIDPSVPGRVWRVGEWIGLVAWAAVLAGALLRARRELRAPQHGR